MVIWRKRASSQRNITGPIAWPIASIQPDKKYEISFRFQNALAVNMQKLDRKLTLVNLSNP